MALSKIDSPAIATLSDNIAFADGKGIDFSATSDGSGTNLAEVYSDYETGSWTPTIGQGTISVSYASYTKIGNTVHLRATISTFSDRSSSSAVTIGGLPYTSASNSKTSQGILSRYVNSGGDAIVAYLGQSASEVTFWTTKQSDAYQQVAHNDLSSNSSNLFLTISYIA